MKTLQQILIIEPQTRPSDFAADYWEKLLFGLLTPIAVPSISSILMAAILPPPPTDEQFKKQCISVEQAQVFLTVVFNENKQSALCPKMFSYFPEPDED